MNQDLAENLLAKVLSWDNLKVKENVRMLEDFAELKYDQYQQYEAGSRFIENLATWLDQFSSQEDKSIAFDFVKNALVFISEEEMRHLIRSIYPDYIRPILKKQAKNLCGELSVHASEPETLVDMISRQSLYLGLSDGARLDVFRRSDSRIMHEQVCINYEIPEVKMKEILKEMDEENKTFYEKNPQFIKYKNTLFGIYLLDDFSGSGISYLRYEEDRWKGKINKVIEQLDQLGQKSEIDLTKVPIHLILYIATDQAENNILKNLESYNWQKDLNIQIHILQKIKRYDLNPQEKELFMRQYGPERPEIEDKHYRKGKHDEPYLGFDECSLPLIIYHNTPNNSFPILWGIRPALFPRVTRHKEVN